MYIWSSSSSSGAYCSTDPGMAMSMNSGPGSSFGQSSCSRASRCNKAGDQPDCSSKSTQASVSAVQQVANHLFLVRIQPHHGTPPLSRAAIVHRDTNDFVSGTTFVLTMKSQAQRGLYAVVRKRSLATTQAETSARYSAKGREKYREPSSHRCDGRVVTAGKRSRQ